MLERIGEALNWAAAGLLFPLMMLPLAGLLARGRIAGSALFAGLTLSAAAAGALFAHLAPDLSAPALSKREGAFALAVVVFAGVAAAAGGPAALSARLAPIAGAIANAAGRLTFVFVLAMALIQFASVILRYVFGLNFIALQESVTYLHGAVFLLAGGYALLTDDHVRVDIFYREASARRKALVDLIGTYLFLFPFCLVLLWAAAPYIASSWAVREGSTEQSGIEGVFILKSLIAAFAVLIALAGFALAARSAARLSARDG